MDDKKIYNYHKAYQSREETSTLLLNAINIFPSLCTAYLDPNNTKVHLESLATILKANK